MTQSWAGRLQAHYWFFFRESKWQHGWGRWSGE